MQELGVKRQQREEERRKALVQLRKSFAAKFQIPKESIENVEPYLVLSPKEGNTKVFATLTNKSGGEGFVVNESKAGKIVFSEADQGLRMAVAGDVDLVVAGCPKVGVSLDADVFALIKEPQKSVSFNGEMVDRNNEATWRLKFEDYKFGGEYEFLVLKYPSVEMAMQDAFDLVEEAAYSPGIPFKNQQ